MYNLAEKIEAQIFVDTSLFVFSTHLSTQQKIAVLNYLRCIKTTCRLLEDVVNRKSTE